MNDEPIVVSHNKEADRYEVRIASHIAVLTYVKKGQQITFLHTGVPPALEGHGIANELAHTALEDARAKHLIVVPACPYVFAYIQRHPEYLPLVAETERARFNPQVAEKEKLNRRAEKTAVEQSQRVQKASTSKSKRTRPMKSG